MDKKYFRYDYDVIDFFEDDPNLDFTSRRYEGITEVLRRIPQDDYEKLLIKKDTFRWFIPPKDQFGLVQTFEITHDNKKLKSGHMRREQAQIIYLSPELEKLETDISIAVIAHELAHVFFEHEETYQEKEAWELVHKWGFEKELKKYKALRDKQEKDKKVNHGNIKKRKKPKISQGRRRQTQLLCDRYHIEL